MRLEPPADPEPEGWFAEWPLVLRWVRDLPIWKEELLFADWPDILFPEGEIVLLLLL